MEHDELAARLAKLERRMGDLIDKVDRELGEMHSAVYRSRLMAESARDDMGSMRALSRNLEENQARFIDSVTGQLIDRFFRPLLSHVIKTPGELTPVTPRLAIDSDLIGHIG